MLRVRSKRTEPVYCLHPGHGPRSLACHRTVFAAGHFRRPKPPCEFVKLIPGSAGRDAPDDHPATSCARVRSEQMTEYPARPSPGRSGQHGLLMLVVDHGEGGRRLARPAFPTGFPRGDVGSRSDLD